MKFLFRLLAALAGASLPLLAGAQTYPSHPVRLVVPFAAGGGTDLIGRLVAQSLSQTLGQQVVVDNKGGAGTIIGSDTVAKAAPDGYTLLLNGSTLGYLPAMFKKLPFDAEKDLRKVTLVSEQPYLLVVNKSVPANTLQQFIDLARSQPGQLAYLSAGIGSATHLESELLWHELGVKLLHIPYKGTSQGLADLLSDKVQVMYTTLAAAAELVRADKVKPLAISSAKRSEALPTVPTVAEVKKTPFNQVSSMSIFVPAGTPAPVVQKIFDATTAAVRSPELISRFKSEGLAPVLSKSPEEADQAQKRDIARWRDVVKSAGIEPQ